MKRFYASLVADTLLLIALIAPAQSRAQTPDLGPACRTGYHRASWQRCPMNDVADKPALPCETVDVCLPNCPEGYRTASHSDTDVAGEPACVPIKPAAECSPLSLQVFYAQAVPVVWHWRAEISEKCATLRLRTPIRPVYEKVQQKLRGEAVGKFQVVVGPDGEVTGSKLLSAGYTSLPQNAESYPPLRPKIFSDMAATTIRQLRFLPYLLHDSPMEFQTTVTIPFKLKP